MFCSNCGKQIEDGAAFCSGCGTSLNSQQAAQTPQPVYQQPINQQPVQQPTSGKSATKKGRTIGIVLLVCFVLAIMGGSANGSFERYITEGVGLDDIVTILLDAGLLIGGIYMIIKNKKQ
ncbi:MAG: zinc-ribbon domain-containing protein [Clostridia bacterium]|nr:zinc-ribbon domain-containing protein [Clostridia bacterium]